MFEYIEKVHRCADCSIRCKAAEKPHSLFARIHRWHMTWWPAGRFTKRGYAPAVLKQQQASDQDNGRVSARTIARTRMCGNLPHRQMSSDERRRGNTNTLFERGDTTMEK